ncbi:SDR family oxidoreductase [Rhizobium sp. Leaf383]|uniref:SDR family NAD(P)-dependent oxidoreductase n=1 Tax=Rhizobium sp. Leaf383 TaxID=1736357 RepID=UPI000712776B|nr:SDR family oxidoreductase [Rhizobium sp. Leaf383]KQS82642.1 oxidoreductase [Rhizobium sp. Leaf383]
MTDFNGKIALVTGTSGIGLASAIRLAAGGAKVLACGNDPTANALLDRISKERGLEMSARLVDVSREAEVQDAVGDVVGRNGGIDILVNAAAVHPFGTVLDTSFETWNRCLTVNVGSIYLTGRFAIPELIKRGGGSIVNISSVQGYACQENVAAYVASKGAIHALTRAMALDHAAAGVRVNSISPGSVRTPLLSLAARTYGGDGVSEKDAFARFGAAHPIGRIGEPEEVAELVAYLSSDRGAFITGSDFRIDGGLTAGIGVK